MIGSLVARVAGPRVLLGVAAASALAIGLLWWRLEAAQDTAATERQRAAALAQAVTESETTIARLLADQRRLSRELVARERERAQTADQLQEATDALAELEARNAEIRAWSRGAVPGPVRDWMRHATRAGDPDPGGAPPAATGPAPRVSDAAVPNGDPRRSGAGGGEPGPGPGAVPARD